MTIGDCNEIISRIQYRDAQIRCFERSFDKPAIQFCIYLPEFDAIHGWPPAPGAVKHFVQVFGRVLVLKTLTEKIVLEEILAMIDEFQRHEAREWFRYKGEMIFDPHKGDSMKKPLRCYVGFHVWKFCGLQYNSTSVADWMCLFCLKTISKPHP